MPLEELGHLELITSWHGLMKRNETLWRFSTGRPVIEVLDEMQRRLESAGWKTMDFYTASDQRLLRMSRNTARLTAYGPSPQGPPPSDSPREPILIQYVDRMTQDELPRRSTSRWTQNTSTNVLLCFEHHWSDDQSRRVLKAPISAESHARNCADDGQALPSNEAR